MATGMQVWSVVPVTNATADSNVNWAEGMAPSQVNDSSRAVMASAAKWVADNSGVLTTSGSTTALTLATNQVEGALTTGYTVTATLGTAVAAAATLAVDGLAAAPIYTSLSTASAVTTGSLALGQICSLVYSTAITGVVSAWVVKAVSPVGPVLTTLTNSLAADVTMNSTSYFTGPTVSQGTTGTWYASGTVTLNDPTNNGQWNLKLWDGTTVIASGELTLLASQNQTMCLSGAIASPAGNINISASNNHATGLMKANLSGNSKDSTLTVIRIA